ncbi:MAG TPA: NAD(P)-dependent oxidoreductase [Terriglobia bacterium]|nr:NAD(P)-dependent oxidoreductase [Terriglobia bacterium]
MRVAFTGAAGLFGHGLVEAFSTRHEVFPLTHAEADITDAQSIRGALERIRPDLVVHPAGIPDIDICEADPALAFRVNYQGTCNVVAAARSLGAGLAHISTDAVFDGRKVTPYVETDPTGPITVYGRTKLQAEQAVETLERYWIFRVSVLFGPGKINFVEKGLRKVAAGEEYKVASDQLGCATHTVDAGLKIMEVAEAGRYGLYHLANQGECTRYELARTAVELAGLDPAKVIGVPDALMQRRAPRLKYAVMEMEALRLAGFVLPRPWQEALADYVHRVGH